MALEPAAVVISSEGVAVKVPVHSVTVPSKVAADPDPDPDPDEHKDKVISLVTY